MTLYHSHIVITHEGDPAWLTAVLNGAHSLLALRHVVDIGADELNNLISTIVNDMSERLEAVSPIKDGRVPSWIAFVSNDLIVTMMGINLIVIILSLF